MIIDLLIPKFNNEFTSYRRYFSYESISKLIPFYKKISIKNKKYINGIYCISDYKNKTVKNLIHRGKYSFEYSIFEEFGKIIFEKIFIEGDMFIPNPDVIIPVPYDKYRYLKRGYSAPYILANHISNQIIKDDIGDVFVYNGLIKKYHTLDQYKLNRKNREKNIRNSFELSPEIKSISGKTIVWIVDDISTTGATICECAKILKTAYPYLEIYGVCIASG